jgi:hypothetical protein
MRAGAARTPAPVSFCFHLGNRLALDGGCVSTPNGALVSSVGHGISGAHGLARLRQTCAIGGCGDTRGFGGAALVIGAVVAAIPCLVRALARGAGGVPAREEPA